MAFSRRRWQSLAQEAEEMEKRYQIFVSSTYKDLQEERQEVAAKESMNNE